MDVEEVYRHVDRVLDVQKVLGLESHIVLIDLMVMGIRSLDSLCKFCFWRLFYLLFLLYFLLVDVLYLFVIFCCLYWGVGLRLLQVLVKVLFLLWSL